MFVIVSMTTIPIRKELLLKTLPYILKQKFVKKICINLDNNLSKEDYDFYDKLPITDSRIEINKECDPKWRSCNKLLPTIRKYPNDAIVTMDDDISYDENCVKDLVEMYERHSDCIVAQELNPVVYEDGMLKYKEDMDIKLLQKEYGKYLSHSCLFPPHVFDDTDVFDYDKMMKLTDGMHDELWFWEQTVLKGIKTIGLDSTLTYAIDSTIKHEESDYQLSNTNKHQEKIDDYNKRFNEEYRYKIYNLLNDPNTCIEFFVTKANFFAHVFSLPYLKATYNGFKLKFILSNELKQSHIWFLQARLNIVNFNNATILKERP